MIANICATQIHMHVFSWGVRGEVMELTDVRKDHNEYILVHACILTNIEMHNVLVLFVFTQAL